MAQITFSSVLLGLSACAMAFGAMNKRHDPIQVVEDFKSLYPLVNTLMNVIQSYPTNGSNLANFTSIVTSSDCSAVNASYIVAQPLLSAALSDYIAKKSASFLIPEGIAIGGIIAGDIASLNSSSIALQEAVIALCIVLGEKVSDIFCKADADITFRSCDGVLFKVHRKNLESASEGFSAPKGTNIQAEIVPLTEDESTLRMLFQYMYPQRHSDLRGIEFQRLAELSEAAEKYQVYSAMLICNVRMEELVTRQAYLEHPFEVMIYAMRHGYVELMSKSERVALKVSQTLAFESFTPPIYIAWWMDLLVRLQESLKTVDAHPHNVDEQKWFMSVVSQLNRPAALLEIKQIIQVGEPRISFLLTHASRNDKCRICQRHIEKWADGAMKDYIKKMKRLTSFL
ncbi:hypothetical protein HWV62_29232 [Athelia sp. TMB]|nr:hypothetical protein HWV62_29232 [Athelia sp. TMB]